MDLRLVEYFVAVVDHGGVTKAANALYIAQPSLSQAIRNLEKELGVELFDRSGRQMTLTHAGELFSVPAREALRDASTARGKVEAVRALSTGRLHIAALPTLASDVLPDMVSALRRAHPGIQVHISDPGGPTDVENAVRTGQVEIGLTELPLHSPQLESRPMGFQTMVLALPPALAQDLPDPVPLERVVGLPLVLGPTDASKLSVVDEAVERVSGNVIVRSTHRETVMSLVTAGVGATFLPRALAERELVGVVLRSTVPEITREIGVVHRSGPLSPAAQRFLQFSLSRDG